jgi:hypothetical protein
LKVDFTEWTLAAKLDESTFVFDPPPGAEKIVMTAIEDVKASDVKDGKP